MSLTRIALRKFYLECKPSEYRKLAWIARFPLFCVLVTLVAFNLFPPPFPFWSHFQLGKNWMDVFGLTLYLHSRPRVIHDIWYAAQEGGLLVLSSIIEIWNEKSGTMKKIFSKWVNWEFWNFVHFSISCIQNYDHTCQR